MVVSLVQMDLKLREGIKIKSISHTDLDGVVCPIMLMQVFGENAVDATYCENGTVDETIDEFIESQTYEFFDAVIITDISISTDLAKKIHELRDLTETKFYLYDHHKSALYLNDLEMDWIKVIVDHDGVKQSATSILAAYLPKGDWTPEVDAIAEVTRMYDTWEWYDKGVKEPKKLNDLFYLLGRDKFIERFMKNSNVMLTDTEEMLLSVEGDRIERYIQSKINRVSIVNRFNGHTVAFVHAEQYISELGNAIANTFPQCDYVVITNPATGKISYRTIHEHIDLSVIAKIYGGGGHPKSAGSQTDEKQTVKLIKDSLPKKKRKGFFNYFYDLINGK